MRVVLDANVFVSAAIQAGPSHRIVQAWLEEASFEVIMCPELLAEIEDVLTTRPRLRRWIDLDTARLFVATVRTVVDLVPDPQHVASATRNEGDDYLIALALEHGADLIVTGDRDLLEWAAPHPAVIAPAVFETLLDDPGR